MTTTQLFLHGLVDTHTDNILQCLGIIAAIAHENDSHTDASEFAQGVFDNLGLDIIPDNDFESVIITKKQ